MSYRREGENNLFCREDSASIAYSDGLEAEYRLHQIVSSASDRSVSSSELAQQITDWPSEYHLSRSRHCLLRPLGIQPGDSVLEIGCGCGALTRYLGELGANVVAVEGSLVRARIAAERCAGLANVAVYADNLLEFETEQHFDWVLLVGVLEYAPVYSRSKDPLGDYIRIASRYLNEGGRLVVAIENKLGLKYLNGCSEDHLGRRYIGVEGLYQQHQPITLGRRELIQLLEKEGMTNTQFFYPFPDYKLPSVVLSEDALTTSNFDAADLLARSHSRDYTGWRYRNFDEALVSVQLIQNGILQDLSNSFLIVARREPAASKEQTPFLAMAFSPDRIRQFAALTKFTLSGATIDVVKEPLFPAETRSVQLATGTILTNLFSTNPYVPGRQITWQVLAARASGEMGTNALLSALLPWFEFLLSFAEPQQPQSDEPAALRPLSSLVLDGKYLDCTPFNILRSGDLLHLIDCEWSTSSKIPAGWVATRALLYTLPLGATSSTEPELSTVLGELCAHAGLTVSREDIHAWRQMEADFQTAVLGVKKTPASLDGMPCRALRTEQQLQVPPLRPSKIAPRWQRRPQLSAQARGGKTTQERLISRISDLQSEIEAAWGERAAALIRLDEVEARSKQVEHEAGNIKAEAAAVKAEADSIKAEACNIRTEAGRVNAEADAIKVHAAESERRAQFFQEELQKALASRSWRLTRPLRAFSKLSGLSPGGDPGPLESAHTPPPDAYLNAAPEATEPATDAEVPISNNALAGTDPTSTQQTQQPPAQAHPAPEGVRDAYASDNEVPPTVTEALKVPCGREAWDEYGRRRLEQLFASDMRLKFQTSENPDISVLLVFYNSAHLSLLCLESILANVNVSHEIVIVDNGSEDETARLLERLDGVRIIRNQVNHGFGEACMRGVEEATGQYICFLNNDALLQPGTLEAAMENFASDPRVGAVGGKLVFADGRLQEAGSIVWSDGSAWGYGRNGDPASPQYEFRRPVDYCSGAFLVTRNDLFCKMGGFSTRFFPAYYEDTDYCMSLWANGLRVIYEPRAVIRHYESASHESSESAKPLMALHRQRFVAEWRDVLAQHLPAKSENVHDGRFAAMLPKLKIIYIDDQVPHRNLGSGFPRSNDILCRLAEQEDRVTCVSMSAPLVVDYSDVPREVEFFDGQRHFDRLLTEYLPHADIVWVRRPHNMERLLQGIVSAGVEVNFKIVYDAETIVADRERLKARVLGRKMPPEVLDVWRERELAIAKAADGVVCVSPWDAAGFMAHGIANVHVVGHQVDAVATPASFRDRNTFLFVGTMDGLDDPNADAMLYFCREVWPLLQRRTGASLVIAGLGAQEIGSNFERFGARVLGAQADLKQLYNEARVFIVPTRYSGGIPLEAYEGAGYGVPLVVSSLVGQQLGWNDGEDCLIAEDATAFAESCYRLFSEEELWERLRSSAYARVRQESAGDKFQLAVAKVVGSVNVATAEAAK